MADLNKQIPITTLMKLPFGSDVVGTSTAVNIDGKKRDTIVVMFTHLGVRRKADFDIETGEYLGDHV